MDQMRIDPKGAIAGYPAVVVRDTLRRLRGTVGWSLRSVEWAARLPAGQGRKFVRALVTAGLVEVTGKDTWELTQAGQTLSSATAAPRVKRETATKALEEFLGRVAQVNQRRYYLGKVVTVVLFGSMLKPEVERVSDVDVAVEIVPREADPDRARVKNWRRVRELELRGARFHGLLGRDLCWYWEVFDSLKGGARLISLSDLKREGELILAAPHKYLFEKGRWSSDAPRRVSEHLRATEISEDELF